MDILAGLHCTWENGDPRLQGSQSWRSSGEIIHHIQQEASHIKAYHKVSVVYFRQHCRLPILELQWGEQACLVYCRLKYLPNQVLKSGIQYFGSVYVPNLWGPCSVMLSFEDLTRGGGKLERGRIISKLSSVPNGFGQFWGLVNWSSQLGKVSIVGKI